MLNKLAYKNAKRSIKDYLVYLATVTLSFTLIFSFNMLVFSKDIQALSTEMKNFKITIIMVSILILFVIGWLIQYTMRFMLEKRSKEFGNYLVLGIEKKDISKMFLLENLLIGLLALALSFFLGNFMTQIQLAVIMNIFKLPFHLNFSFTMEPYLLTLFYFSVIYLFVLWRLNRKIKKLKVYGLLYFDKKNENLMLKKSKNRKIIFFGSILLQAISLYMIDTSFDNPDNMNFSNVLLATVLLIIGIYMFYTSITSFIKLFILKNPKRKYHKDTLFITRNLTSKINTMGFTMATLALLITLTLISLNVGNMLKGVFDNTIKKQAPYDITIYKPEESNFKEDIETIQKEYTIKEKYIYKTYTTKEVQVQNHIQENIMGYQKADCYLKISDYNRLLEMRKERPIKLKENEYIIHTTPSLKKDITNFVAITKNITIDNRDYQNKEIITDNYATAWAPGFSFLIIVPDKAVENMVTINSILNINTKERTTEAFYNKLEKNIKPTIFVEEKGDAVYYTYQNLTIKGQVEANNNTTIIIISFSILYLACIFIATVGTVLAIQSLSDSTKYRFRYQVLKKLGKSEKEINHIVLKQLLLYFSFPFLFPLLLSIIITLSVNQIFFPFFNHTYQIWIYIVLSFAMFSIVYLIYFISTYLSFKKNIE